MLRAEREQVSRALQALGEAVVDNTKHLVAAAAAESDGGIPATTSSVDRADGVDADPAPATEDVAMADEKGVAEEEGEAAPAATGHVHIYGAGKAVTKAVSVVEIIKSRVVGLLHQETQILQARVDDFFTPKAGSTEGLDVIKATRNVPAISISLSKE